MKRVILFVAVICLTASLANANLLSNGDFNDPASAAVPTDWLNWSWNAGWANHENNAPVTYDGSYYLNTGNAWYDGGGGFYQTGIVATAGLQYQLDVLSGADAWWLPTGRMTMFFEDSLGTELLRAERNTVDPAVYGNNYDIPHPWAPYSLTATAPANTTQIKVEFASNNPGGVGGAIWFENAVLTASPIPEPGTAALVVLGSALLIGYRSRRTAKRA